MTVALTVQNDNRSFFMATWSELGADEEGAPIQYPNMPVKTVQISGELSGGSIVLQGSMDGETWVTLRHTGATVDQGEGIELAPINAAGMFVIHENPRYVRPVITDGDGSTDVSVIVVAAHMTGG